MSWRMEGLAIRIALGRVSVNADPEVNHPARAVSRSDRGHESNASAPVAFSDSTGALRWRVVS